MLAHPYDCKKAKLIIREMTELLALDLVDKGLVTDQLTLNIGYDIENLTDVDRAVAYKGEITTDHYGRKVPKAAHGSINIGRSTSSTRLIMDAMLELYDRIVDKNLLVRRMSVVANHVVDELSANSSKKSEQLSLFTDYTAEEEARVAEEASLAREKKMQKAVLEIKKRYGKNAILKGNSFEEGATAIERNGQIGGHKA